MALTNISSPTQISVGPVADTEAALLKLRIISSVLAKHGPTGSSVDNVMSTLPFKISVGPGVYIAFRLVLSSNEPSPAVDH